MENKSHALAAGTFVLLLAALVVALAVWLMRDTSQQRQIEISSPYGVTGLQVQAGVRYKGVPVGRVVAIGLDPLEHGNVLVRIAVQDQAPITSRTYATLAFQGVTGLAFVQLEDDTAGADAPLPPAPPGQWPRIPMRRGWMARLTEQGDRMVHQMEQVSERLNALLAPDNQDRLMAAINRLGAAATSLQQLAQHADAAVQPRDGQPALDLPALAQQAQQSLQTMQATAERLGRSAEVVRDSAAEFRKASVRMNESGGTLERVARGADALSSAGQALNNSVVPRLNRTLDEAQRTARQFGRVADNVAAHPQSLLFGGGAPAPGPGEPGFVAPPAQ